jgi:hypothetical protein
MAGQGSANNQLALKKLAKWQRYYGTLFECYRRGIEFDIEDSLIEGLIETRNLPRTGIIDAYDAQPNATLRQLRDYRNTWKLWDRTDRP